MFLEQNLLLILMGLAFEIYNTSIFFIFILLFAVVALKSDKHLFHFRYVRGLCQTLAKKGNCYVICI